MRSLFLLVICVLCLMPRSADAANLVAIETQVRELAMTVNELRLVVEAQQKEIAALKAAPLPPAPAPAPVVEAAPARPATQGRWNPDIGVMADTALTFDSPKADAEGADRLSVRQVEFVFGSAVDPYSRMDVTAAFSDFEEAALEEAYLTRYGVPGGLTARAGRFRPVIGKAVPIHRDSLETVNEPLAVERYFGSEGMSRTGADVTKILNLQWPSVHQAWFGVLEGGTGEGGTAFGTTRRRPTIYSHLKNYWDVSDLSNFELGLSHAAGSKDEDAHFEVNVLGLDATWIHHLDAQRKIKLQGEGFYMNREETFTFNEDSARDLGDLDGTLWAGYLLGDIRFAPRWSAGLRGDYVELVNNPVANPDKADTGVLAYLTFYQSEFARWRLQFEHRDLATGNDDDRIQLQGVFAIGEHKHKIQ